MIEVFRTNVTDPAQANLLIERIHRTFNTYQANFDLNDCDRILRVRSSQGSVQSYLLIDLIRKSGFHAEVLPDDLPAIDRYARLRSFMHYQN